VDSGLLPRVPVEHAYEQVGGEEERLPRLPAEQE
jgi:hypothetical protein